MSLKHVYTGLLCSLLRAHRSKGYRGPVSDHFDGRKFFNPWDLTTRGFGDLLKWWATGKAAPWPKSLPNGSPQAPPSRVPGMELRVASVGHSTLLIQTAGLNILTDPVWSDRAGPLGLIGPKRVRQPGIRLDDLPPVDVVLVSHNHYDHLDLPTLAALWEKHRPTILAPLGNAGLIEGRAPGMRCRELDWWQAEDIGSVRITATPSHHWSARGMFDRRNALWASFVIEAPWGNICFFGDTGFGEGEPFRLIRDRFGPVRLALLPIGAYEPRWFMAQAHMNPEEAVEAFMLLGAERAVAHHHGVFRLTDEAVDQPMKDLDAALGRNGLPREFFLAPLPGESLTIR